MIIDFQKWTPADCLQKHERLCKSINGVMKMTSLPFESLLELVLVFDLLVKAKND